MAFFVTDQLSVTMPLASACGRKQPFKIAVFNLIERPLLVKAVIQIRGLKIGLVSDRIGPGSSR